MGATTSVAALEPGEVGAASGGAGTSAKTAELDKYGGETRNIHHYILDDVILAYLTQCCSRK